MKRVSPISRRKFVANAGMTVTAAGILGVGIDSTNTSGAETAPRIRVGFLGSAHSHFREKYRLIRESPDWQLAGVCERHEAVRRRGPEDVAWLSEEELFAQVDVVVVESAVRDHAGDARRALLAGKHVHLEKPPAHTLQGLRDLLRLATEQKRLLQIGYMWRYNPGINAVLEAARLGWLGDIYLVRATINTLVGPEQRREWAEFPGGSMFELGCHLIDPLVRLMGRPRKVTSFLQQSAPASNDTLADNCIAVFEFAKAMGIITSAPLQPNAGPQRFFEVLATNGTARVQPLEAPILTLDLATPAGPYAKGRQNPALPAYRRYVDEFAALAGAIRGGKALPFGAEIELEVQAALMEACRMA